MPGQDFNSLIMKGLSSVTKTIEAQKDAVAHLDHQYKTDTFSQVNLLKSLDILLSTKIKGGKIVLCGVGKSYKICCKLTATLNSLSIQSVSLHPTEALHGDLGMLNDKDCILMLTASGNTPELLNLLPHVSNTIPIILLTCGKTSKLASHPQIGSLLYTELPPHLKEDTIHGIPAPTVSASLSLILADSVILALAELLEEDVLIRKKMFSMKHPGGSIGANLSYLNDNINLSSTIKTQSSSYSSFLSLDQFRSDLDRINSEVSSSISSDDDELLVNINGNNGASIGKFNQELTTNIKNANPNKIFKITLNQIEKLDELSFLKNITIFDYWLITSKDGNLGCDCSDLKSFYNGKNNDWDGFSSNLISKFSKLGN